MTIDSDSDKLAFITRVWRNDATRRGLAAAAAGVLIAAIGEAIWPST
ncbi:MAG: hypothetical protein IT348_11065 [Candidatus Eisenbacteria bacterium]|nr:hypothetical protein [Candidatus Eisenbacteria bacterium]